MNSKSQMRSQLASLPIVEKMRVLDAMRERALELQAATETAALSGVLHEEPTVYQNRESGSEG